MDSHDLSLVPAFWYKSHKKTLSLLLWRVLGYGVGAVLHWVSQPANSPVPSRLLSLSQQLMPFITFPKGPAWTVRACHWRTESIYKRVRSLLPMSTSHLPNWHNATRSALVSPQLNTQWHRRFLQRYLSGRSNFLHPLFSAYVKYTA